MTSPEFNGRPVLQEQVEAIRTRFSIGYSESVDVDELARQLGIEVTYEDTDGYLGCLIQHPNGIFIIVSQNRQSRARQRFTLAHEIGHYLLHTTRDSDQTVVTFDDEETLTLVVDSGKEQAANDFARALLVPTQAFEQVQLGPINLALIADVARRYEVTHAAATVRYLEVVNPRAVVVRLDGSSVHDRFRSRAGHRLVVPADILVNYLASFDHSAYDVLTLVPLPELPRYSLRICHLGRDYFLVESTQENASDPTRAL